MYRGIILPALKVRQSLEVLHDNRSSILKSDFETHLVIVFIDWKLSNTEITILLKLKLQSEIEITTFLKWHFGTGVLQ